MKKRFSIWGTQHGSNHESELAQCDSNPQAVVDGFVEMTVKVKLGNANKKSKIRKYTWLHVFNNETGEWI